MVIIVTGTVNPDGGVKKLAIRETSIRLEQYRNSIEKLVDAVTGAKIIFCENSGYGTEAFEDLKGKAQENGSSLEILSFNGDSQAVISYGKGYGEGEIVEYVFNNSKLIENETFFIKITGRLMVDNISKIVRTIKNDRMYFNIPNIHLRNIYDTRIYSMPVKTFKAFFINRYKTVNDDCGYYLEHAYTQAIAENNLKVRNFPSYPRIVGVSGSGGIQYGYVEWKSKIRDILSVFNFYGRVNR